MNWQSKEDSAALKEDAGVYCIVVDGAWPPDLLCFSRCGLAAGWADALREEAAGIARLGSRGVSGRPQGFFPPLFCAPVRVLQQNFLHGREVNGV